MKCEGTNGALSWTGGRKVYSGHYFLQYFNVKSSGFLEPSYRFLQEKKPSGRPAPREVERVLCGAEGGRGRQRALCTELFLRCNL